MDTCKYVHYEIDAWVEPGGTAVGIECAPSQDMPLVKGVGGDPSVGRLFPSQVTNIFFFFFFPDVLCIVFFHTESFIIE